MSVLSADSIRLLQAIFQDWWGEAWVCWTSNMKGKRVKNLVPGDLPDEEDCYFSIALMKPGATGRTKENAKSVHALVIDDVGTKIDRDGFEMLCSLKPTWTIETSPGNFHVGFVIAEGITPRAYKELRLAMAGHCVWGKSDSDSDPVHLYRLPQGTNTKHGRAVR